MPQKIYSNIYFHVIWRTKNSEPRITGEDKKIIYSLIIERCKQERGLKLLASGGIEDHIHLVLKVPPTIVMSKFIGELKGASSYRLNKMHPESPILWQTGYGLISVSPQDSDRIINYVNNQQQHHANGQIYKDFEIS